MHFSVRLLDACIHNKLLSKNKINLVFSYLLFRSTVCCSALVAHSRATFGLLADVARHRLRAVGAYIRSTSAGPSSSSGSRIKVSDTPIWVPSLATHQLRKHCAHECSSTMLQVDITWFKAARHCRARVPIIQDLPQQQRCSMDHSAGIFSCGATADQAAA